MNDLRYALRQFAKHPGFTAVVVLTLALGIGANTAIFSVVHGVLMRPLPYHEPDRLVAVWESNPGPGWRGDRNNVTDGNYADWRARNRVFEELGAYGQAFGIAVLGPDFPVELTANRLSPSLFRVLRADAMLGRVFLPEDGVPGGEPVVLLSHRIWRDLFGSDPAIVGRTVQLEESPFTVVGVMPPTFGFPNPEHDVWIPLRVSASGPYNRVAHRWRVVGRLAPDVTLERAQADMDAIAHQLRDEHPALMEGWSVRVVPYHADLVRTARPLLFVLLGVVNILLLIACANVANLLLARAIRREHELAVRGALGGTRWRIVRQLFTEVGVLAILGVVAGVALGALGVKVLLTLAPRDIPRIEGVGLDPMVLAYVGGITGLTTLLFGLLPAWGASRTELDLSLKGSRGSTGSIRHGRVRSTLLVAELALSMMLLVGAGLLVRSFLQLQAVDHGFEPKGLLAVGINLPNLRYEGHRDREAFYRRAAERLAALPQADAVAGTTEPPLIGFNDTYSFWIEGRPAAEPDGREQPVEAPAVTEGFFAAMRIPVHEGRVFTAFDRPGQPDVAAVNRTLAQRYWPGESALGRRISFESHEGPWIEIVGIVGDIRQYGLDQPVEPVVYLPYAQNRRDWLSWMTFMIRMRGDPLEAAPAVQRAIWGLDDRLAIRRLAPVTELYAEHAARRRFAAALTASFAGVAVLLGLVGIFGVISYSVAQREREFGLRMALGAERRRIALGVLRQGLVLGGIGVAVGLLGALLLTRLLQSLLFGVTQTDPLTLVATALLLMGVALFASWLPARRAARIDPMEALRHE